MPGYLYVLFVLLVYCPDLFSGEPSKSRNLIYAEILGAGGYGSVNYEKLVYRKGELSMGMRVGAGTYNVRDFTGNINPDLIFPFSINTYIYAPHSIEVGLGNTFSSIVQVSQANWQPVRVNRLSANFAVGYRYAKKEGGFVFRLGYTPIYEFYKRFVHWGGVSFGYAF